MSGRVLLLSQEVHPLPPTKGAAVEQWIEAVAHRLSRHEPHLVSVPHPSRPDCETDGGVHYRRIRMSVLYKRLFRKLTRLDPWSYIDRVLHYARAIRPAIVHVHNAPQFVDALREGLPQARIILHMHNEKAHAVRHRVDALAGCSAYIRNWYEARRFPADRFVVLDNGVDLAAHASVREAQAMQAMRQRHAIPGDKFVVLYVGRISPEKGPDLAVQALQRLDRERFHLMLVGEWPQGDPRRSERVRFAQGLREQLAGLSHTLVDSVPPSQMPGMYALGDLLLIPSRFEEPFSMVAIEAMAAGLPVMALAKGGMTEYMVDQCNALVLPAASSAEAISRAIGEAASQPERLRSLAGEARLLVTQRFGWDRVAAATESLYDQVLQGGRP